jgi:hypothetical protein
VPRAPLTDVVPRRTLVIIAVVVALAVIGTVLALTIGGGDDSGSKSGKGSDTKAAASSGVTAGSGGKGATAGSHTDSGDKKDGATGSATDGSSGSTPDTDASGDAAATNGTSGTDGTSGDGKESGSSGSTDVTTYTAGQGFKIGLPAGWKYRSTDDAGARFTGPDGQKLLVGWTTTPKSDPVADWKNQEGYMVRSQYKRVRIEKVDYRRWNTADWEFTYQDGGTKYQSIDRGFVVNDHLGYGLMYTAKASDWDSQLRKDTWQTLTATFQPKS